MTNLKQQEEELFEAALNLTNPVARGAFLIQACAGDSVLQERLEKLLVAHEEAESFFRAASQPETGVFESCVAGPPDEQARPSDLADDTGSTEVTGSRIGPYKLLQKIGEGGCGIVYMAEQERPVRRRIALKIIKLGMDTKSVIARFEAERQALAIMDHVNIARVLDAGATEAGRPYFVMELVRGKKITDYCNQAHLETTGRLRLFIHVCRAVQHAHQKGIIHRDIKPSNILVTMHDGVPVPKVIDFGIAKATEGRLTDKTLFTAYEHFIGTPAYMSPEQAELSGLDVDTRSDIYSLGVLLYELLAGKPPFDPKELVRSGFDEMRRTLREKEPQRPSTMLTSMEGAELTATASQRHVEPPKLISQLRGDLDWIVLKALEKDRTRRYETANGLAMDVERYLNDEPVLARPPSRLYRFQKLVRRNQGVFTAVSTVSVALLLGFGTSTCFFIKEREAHRRALAAEQRQSRMREDAERGLAKENELRLQAEARERMTRAAVLLSNNQLREADALIAQGGFTNATLEGAAVFRSLGDWNALQGRWPEAADRLERLLQVGQIESGDLATLDCTRCGSTLMECRELSRYEDFRRATLHRFSGATDPMVADRVVKICLLAPANQTVMAGLKPLAAQAANSFVGNDVTDNTEEWKAPWRSISLALWDYRLGRPDEAARWCKRCLDYGTRNPSRTATALVIQAMSRHDLKQDTPARADLAQASRLIEDKFNQGLDFGNVSQGFWFDWVLARVLLREAVPLVGDNP
jgi:eukaryotic-like serine/threonine-protein kinase